MITAGQLFGGFFLFVLSSGVSGGLLRVITPDGGADGQLGVGLY